ncbi:MAG: SPFH domain-containing protein [Chloroherpetonaceae bacterium]|nr:SPFH domain-containing protein [Chloroherpetonaceae bacterium]
MGFLIFLGLVALFVIILISKGVRIIQQAEVTIVERLGRYHKTLESGINIIVPIIDKPREIEWRYTRTDPAGRTVYISSRTSKIDMRETLYDFPKQNVITKDNVTMEINALVYFQIIDPVKATYEIGNLPDAIQKITQTTLRNVIGELDLDETLTSRDTINGKLRIILDDATNKWGVKINRVELQDIVPPRDIQDAMEKQMRAERERRAAILNAEAQKKSSILEAEGERESQINKAEGDKRSNILRAEGEAEARIKKAEGDATARIRTAQAEAEAIRLVTEAISKSSNPGNYLIAVRYIEAMKEMVSGKDNKVIYLPYEATGILGSLSGIKELFGNEPKKP